MSVPKQLFGYIAMAGVEGIGGVGVPISAEHGSGALPQGVGLGNTVGNTEPDGSTEGNGGLPVPVGTPTTLGSTVTPQGNEGTEARGSDEESSYSV